MPRRCVSERESFPSIITHIWKWINLVLERSSVSAAFTYIIMFASRLHGSIVYHIIVNECVQIRLRTFLKGD